MSIPIDAYAVQWASTAVITPEHKEANPVQEQHNLQTFKLLFAILCFSFCL